VWRVDVSPDGKALAQLYGGYVLPGSRFDVKGGIGLIAPSGTPKPDSLIAQCNSKPI
jgi:hypothetical protein